MSYKPFEYKNVMHYPALPGNKSVCANCAYDNADCDDLRNAAVKANPLKRAGCTGIIWQVSREARISYITHRLTT